MIMSESVAVIIEHQDGKIAPVSYEALACGCHIARLENRSVVCVVIGQDVEDTARQLAADSGHTCLALKIPGLTSYNPEVYKAVIHEAFRSTGSRWIFVGGSALGMDFAPGLAIRLGLSCLSNIEQTLSTENGPLFLRAMFNGKAAAKLQASNGAVVITRPGCFQWSEELKGHDTLVEQIVVEPIPTRVRTLSVSETEGADSSLCDANVIVAAGRGIKRKENLDLIRRVANLFSRSAIAGSRPLCDDGWLPYRFQVGQTGATVTPELYIACGISGAQQHIAGMRGSKFVVAINTDPDAPIFLEADIGIVEDVASFLDCFIDIEI